MPTAGARILRVAIIGGGPAGLMAAEVLAACLSAQTAQLHIDLYDSMPSVGRKFLLAGKGGLNLTHAEPAESFMRRYGAQQPDLQEALRAFSPAALRDWAESLGIATFVGSSGRVFPVDMKAAPLLRAWLHRLRAAGVRFHMRHRWLGWEGSDAESGSLQFASPAGLVHVQADAVILALGGASWARLGSDGAWVPLLRERGVDVAPLQPSNCGFDVAASPLLQAQANAGIAQAPIGAVEASHPVAEQQDTRRDFFKALVGQPKMDTPVIGWTTHFASRFAGQPLKSVALAFADSKGTVFKRKGEFVATASGIEGSLIYAASSLLRDEIAAHGSALVLLDLLPDHTAENVLVQVRHPRGARSLSSHLKSRLGLDGIKAALLHELLDKSTLADPVQLATAIKALPLRLKAPRPIDEAISSAGGVSFAALKPGLQLSEIDRVRMPVFCAGEMLDWEAPTGGYLMNACMATGKAAGHGVLSHFGLQANEHVHEQLSKV